MAKTSKFRKVFQNLPAEKLALCDDLIENAEFMAETLGKLRTYIRDHGCTDNYKNGENQFGRKRSAESEVYNAMIKNYSSVIKQLVDLLPEKTGVVDELMEYIK